MTSPSTVTLLKALSLNTVIHRYTSYEWGRDTDQFTSPTILNIATTIKTTISPTTTPLTRAFLTAPCTTQKFQLWPPCRLHPHLLLSGVL